MISPELIEERGAIRAGGIAERTLELAAARANVGDRTLRRWLTEDTKFQADYAAARKAATQGAARSTAADCTPMMSHLPANEPVEGAASTAVQVSRVIQESYGEAA